MAVNYPLLKKCYSRLAKYHRMYFAPLPMPEIHDDIVEWFSSGLGKRILAQEQKVLDDLLPGLFGYHLMQMSILDNVCLYQKSSTGHQFSLSNLRPPVTETMIADASSAHSSVMDQAQGHKHSVAQTSLLISSFEDLPIDSDSIDVSLLHHVLEYSVSPQQLLREVTRVTIPSGYIVITGFNPFSMMGLTKPLRRCFSASKHWNYQPLRISRLIDWFQLLGLELVECQTSDFGLPINRYYSPRFDRLSKKVLPNMGAVYTLVLRKNVSSIRMIKTKWKSRRMLTRWNKGVVVQNTSSSQTSSE